MLGARAYARAIAPARACAYARAIACAYARAKSCLTQTGAYYYAPVAVWFSLNSRLWCP